MDFLFCSHSHGRCFASSWILLSQQDTERPLTYTAAKDEIGGFVFVGFFLAQPVVCSESIF